MKDLPQLIMSESVKPKIAVAFAVYNGREWISEQLKSILEQEGVDVIVYISIDPSSDGSDVLCHQFASKYNNINILPDAGVFGGASKNFFRLIRDIDFSSFDYFSFADQDDIWFTDKLITAVNALLASQSDGYSSNVIAFWPTGEQQLVEKSQPQCKWDYLFEAAGPGCTYVMTIELANKLKQTINSNWSEVNKLGLHDWFCYAYARANGFKWFIDPWPSMLYRQHGNNQVGVNHGWKAFIYRFKKVMGGWGIEQSALIAKLVGKSNADFVKSWSGFGRYGFFKLAFLAYKCRRKPIECVMFFFIFILMSVVGKPNNE